MSFSFVIETWAACAPGLDTRARWSDWAAAPWLPQGEPQAPLAAVAPMQRRRFAPLGRLAAQAAFDLRDAAASVDAVPERAMALPASLQAMWFALSDAPALAQRAGAQSCRWSRDA